MSGPWERYQTTEEKPASGPWERFGGNAQPEPVQPTVKSEEKSSGVMQGIGNLLAGAVRGAGSIGATIVAPYDIAKDAINGKGLSLESNRERRAGIDGGLGILGAETDSVLYQGGKLAGEIAGTAGAPGLIAKGAQAAGAAPSIVNSIASSGFKLGTAPAETALAKIGNAAIRTGGAAVGGAAAAGMVNPEDAKTGAMIGAALPGAAKLAGETGKLVKGVATHSLGAMTGAGSEAVRAAFNAGKTGSDDFLKHMRGQAEFDDVVATAKDGLAKMREARANQYRSGMVDISQDKTVLDFAPIDSAMNRVMSIGNYKGVQTNKHASGVVDELSKTVSDWKSLNPAEYHTPEGLDALKRAVGDIRDSTQFGTPARKAADAVYNSVKQEIQTQAPTYSKVMRDYSDASKTLDEITRALSLGDKTSKDTAVRKLQSLMRNNAQTSYGNRLSLANQLEQQGGVSLTPAIAGQAMNTWTPRGMVGAIEKGAIGVGAYMNPAILAAAPAASPRLVGETAYAMGRATGGVSNAASAIGQKATGMIGDNRAEAIRKILEGSMRVAPIIGLANQQVPR